jgi:hypothetical protein
MHLFVEKVHVIIACPILHTCITGGTRIDSEFLLKDRKPVNLDLVIAVK